MASLPRRPVGNSPDDAAEYAERHAAWLEDTRRAAYWGLTDAEKTAFDRRSCTYDRQTQGTNAHDETITAIVLGLATSPVFHALQPVWHCQGRYLPADRPVRALIHADLWGKWCAVNCP